MMLPSTQTIAVANQKGRVGKTTTVLNLGAALAQMEKKTLVVDLDPQGSLSLGLGLDSFGLQETVYSALTDRDFAAERIVYPIKAYLDLLPANSDLASAEMDLVAEVRREFELRRILESLGSWYDFILIDCPPSLDLLTVNALCASQQVFIPMQCEYSVMRGIRLLLETIEEVRARLNPDLELGGILATMYSTGVLYAREALEEIRTVFGEKVFNTVVYKSARFAEASASSQSILDFAATHKGAEAYRQLAQVVVNDRAVEVRHTGPGI